MPDEHLVQVPAPVRKRPMMKASLPDLVGEHRTEAIPPAVPMTRTSDGEVQGHQDPAEICRRSRISPQPLQPRPPSQLPRYLQTEPLCCPGGVASTGGLNASDQHPCRPVQVCPTMPGGELASANTTPRTKIAAVQITRLTPTFPRRSCRHVRMIERVRASVAPVADFGALSTFSLTWIKRPQRVASYKETNRADSGAVQMGDGSCRSD